MSTLIFGHKNPDTDTICSALAYAEIKKQLQEDVEAVRLGSVNKETQFVLDYLEISAPREINSLEAGQEVILVDHNEFNQSCDQIETANIKEVIDHHRIANFQTNDPIYMNIQPVGCTATILYEIAMLNKVNITREMAILMLSAIVSDTLLFKSPTCTNKDQEAALLLADIAQMDINAYGIDMLKAGTDLSDHSAEELIGIDSKEFNTANGHLEVAQINTVDLESFYNEHEAALKNAITDVIQAKELDLFVLLVTNIMTNDTKAIVLGEKISVFETGLNTKVENDTALLPGVVSRKKQVVPFL